MSEKPLHWGLLSAQAFDHLPQARSVLSDEAPLLETDVPLGRCVAPGLPATLMMSNQIELSRNLTSL